MLFTGDQRVHPAAEDAPYLLLEETNTHSATGTPTEQQSVAAADTDTSSQMHRDIVTVMDSVASETVSGPHTAILVELQQVSEVQAADTERYDEASHDPQSLFCICTVIITRTASHTVLHLITTLGSAVCRLVWALTRGPQVQ